MKPIISAILLLVCACMTPTGCGDYEHNGPPTIVLGESMCAECGMMLSDERFATVTVYDGPRGADPVLFDDFNCQAIYESEHQEEPIVARWSHDYLTIQWIPTEQAFFVTSQKIHSPMGAQIAAFATRSGAESFDDEQPPEPMDHTEMTKLILGE